MNQQYTYEEFLDYFTFPHKKFLASQGIYVSNTIYRKFLLEKQNKLTREGRIISLNWKNVGAGVWLVTL
jgi:hypothetical protein